jgi:hypothetical protein
LVKWDKYDGHFHEDLSVFHTVGSDMCSTTIHKTRGCVSTATLVISVTLLTGTHELQQHKGNALLGSHDNNGKVNAPQCCVKRNLPTLSKLGLLYIYIYIMFVNIDLFTKPANSSILSPSDKEIYRLNGFVYGDVETDVGGG